MAEEFTPCDGADALSTDEAIEVILLDAFETADAARIATAFGDVARAKGTGVLERQAGLSDAQLTDLLIAHSSLTSVTTNALL